MIRLLQCPPDAALRGLLADTLDGPAAGPVEAHVEACVACQQRLEGLTANGLPPARGRGLLYPPADDFLARLRATPDAMPPAAVADLPKVPGYELLRELGRGGMGVVYLARQERPARTVALKLVRAASHPGVRERFAREAAAIARLQHPNVVQIYEVGEAAGWPYLALEYVEGTSLDRALNGRPKPPREAAAFLQLLASAMHAAHRRGIVHRDLKPSNVLIAADGTPKVADFGLAKLADGDSDGATFSGQYLGTPSYTAPEQVTAGRDASAVTAAADVYSLGAILYEMLTGRPPFRAPLPIDTLLQVLHHEPVRPGRIEPSVPRDLETVCLTCLNKSPAKRYPSAEALGDDLRRFLAGEPVRARPLGPLGRAARRARRQPAAAGLVAVAMLVVAAGPAGLAWLWREADRRAAVEADGARAARLRAAELDVDRCLAACEQGEVGRGLIGLAGAAADLERLGPAGADQAWAARVNLDAWRHFVAPRRHTLALPAEAAGLAFGPDGRSVYAACADGTVRPIDAATGAAGEPMACPAPLAEVAVAPGGASLCARGADGSAWLWRLPAAAGATPVELPHGAAVEAVAYAPDGRRLVTAGRDGAARSWDAATGGPAGPTLRHPAALAAVGFSADGKRALTADADGTVKQWNPATGASLGVAAQHASPPRHLAYPPAGDWYATGSATDLLGTGPRGEGGPRPRPLRVAHPVTALAYDRTGEFLACGGGSNEFTKGVVAYRFGPREAVAWMAPADGVVRAVALAPGGTRLWAAGDHWRANLWLEPFGRPMQLRLEHAGTVTAFALSPDQSRAATASKPMAGRPGGVVTLWDAPTTPALGLALAQRDVTDLLPLAGGRVLAVGPGAARGFDAATGRPAGEAWVEPPPVQAGEALACGGPGPVWVAAGDAVTPRDPVTGAALPPTVGVPGRVRAVAASPDGRTLAVADDRPALQRYDAATGVRLGPPEAAAFDALAYSPDGGTLAAGDAAGAVRLLRADAAPVELPHSGAVRRLVFSGDGRRLVVAAGGKSASVWDVAAGRRLGPPLVMPDLVTRLAWHPDGRTLAVACLDGTARLWDAATGRPLGPPLLWKAAALAFTPDGSALLVGGREHPVRAWAAPRPRPGTADELSAWAKAAAGEPE